jgi:hypothetical protein
MTDFETSTDFIRLQKAIKSTMISIAIHASYFEDADIERDVDVAFDVLSECFEDIDCICDTVTRRCAKSEIHSVLRDVKQHKSQNDKFDAFQYIEDNIDCESVYEDIIDMNSDDE